MGRVNCSFCRKEYFKDTRHINENRKFGHKFYCSPKCQYTAKNKQVELRCENSNCNRSFKRAPNDISVYNFCSSSCYDTLVTIRNKLGLNKSKAHIINRHYCQYCGNRVPKDQKYCSTKCWGRTREISKHTILKNLVELANKLDRIFEKL